MTRETIKEAYGLSEYVDEKIKALEQRAEKAMSDKRCCITSVTPQQQLCEDVINREVTLNYIRNNYRRWFINDDAFMQCVNGIKDIAPATPQQRTGRWTPVGYDGYADGNPVYDWWECSECGWEHTGDEESLTAFCPNCGCAMKGEME